MACLLDSVCTIIGVFHQYAERHSECSTMKRREMKRLIQKEFGEVLENPRDPQIVKMTFQLLDVNRESLVDFNEFLLFIFEVATACYSGWYPKECLSPKEERSRVVCDGEPHGNENNHRRFQDEDRKGDDVQERRGSDWTLLRPTEEGRRGELGRCYLPSEPEEEEEEEEEERNFQGRDGDRRVRPSREHQERETEPRRLEPRRQEDTETPERRQPRRREPALEEDSPRQSRELVRRNDSDRRQAHGPLDRDERDLYSPMVPFRWEDGRQRRGRETAHREAEGMLFQRGSEARVDQGNHRTERDFERRRPSREPREGGDGRRDLETHDEPRTRAFEPRAADERRDQIRDRRPVDAEEEHRPLPREGERRPQSHETEHRERERGRGERSAFRSREDVRRANRTEEEGVRGSERRRGEGEGSRPRPRGASRRAEAEDPERGERERRRSYSSELENVDRGAPSRESEGRVRRSQHPEEDEQRSQQFSREETRDTERRRRRPQSPEPEPRDPQHGRSRSDEEEPGRDDHRRLHNYEARSPERDVARRRRLQTREPAEREDNRERQRYERASWGSERDRRPPMLLEPETRGEERRRPQAIGSRYGERERLQERDARASNPRRELGSASDGGQRELDPSRPQISRGRTAETSRSEPRSLKPARRG